MLRDSARVREPLRWLLTVLPVHRQGGADDLFIFSSPRSGSTWLMEVLAAEPGMKPINEPFRPPALARAGLRTGLEGRVASRKLKVLDVPTDQTVVYRSYLSHERATRAYGPYDASGGYRLLTNRRVLKDVFSLPLAPWVDDQDLGFTIIYLVRHPIPCALSHVRGVQWRSDEAKAVPMKAEASLRHERFVRRNLTKEQERLGWNILRHGSDLERYVLDWCLDNVVPFRALRARPSWLFLTYEELLLSPHAAVELLAARLAMRRPDKMLARMKVPSKSTVEARDDRQQAVRHHVAAWRDKVPEAEQRRLFEIVGAFEIDIYKLDRCVARRQYRRFAETPCF
jgi:hypothetical protein